MPTLTRSPRRKSDSALAGSYFLLILGSSIKKIKKKYSGVRVLVLYVSFDRFDSSESNSSESNSEMNTESTEFQTFQYLHFSKVFKSFQNDNFEVYSELDLSVSARAPRVILILLSLPLLPCFPVSCDASFFVSLGTVTGLPTP